MKQRELLSTLGKPGPFSPTTSENEHNEVLSEVLQPLTTLADYLDSLSQPRRQLHRAIQRGKRDLAVHFCTRVYLPAVRQVVATYPGDALETERDTVLDRLQRGWAMDATPARTQTFRKLLTRYEIVCDCLADDLLETTFERIERWTT